MNREKANPNHALFMDIYKIQNILIKYNWCNMWSVG